MKTLKIFVLIAFSTIAIFAQEEGEDLSPSQEENISPPEQQEQSPPQVQEQGPSRPDNTVTLDLGPTIIGVGVGIAGSSLGADASGFGFGLQYERQLFERLSVIGRFAYLGFGAGFEENGSGQNAGQKAKLETSISSFSIEAHARTYPFAGSFFLDAMLGYANMSTDFSGTVWAKDDFGIQTQESANIDASRSYFKYGIKLGWRVDFGEPGGFIFEHAFGYNVATAFGKTIPKQFLDKFDDDADVEIGEFDDAYKYLEDFIFVGGPRYTFAFGWRF